MYFFDFTSGSPFSDNYFPICYSLCTKQRNDFPIGSSGKPSLKHLLHLTERISSDLLTPTYSQNLYNPVKFSSQCTCPRREPTRYHCPSLLTPTPTQSINFETKVVWLPPFLDAYRASLSLYRRHQRREQDLSSISDLLVTKDQILTSLSGLVSTVWFCEIDPVSGLCRTGESCWNWFFKRE